MFPTCYLPVSYFPIFTTFYTISHPISFFHFQAPKSTAIAVITVLPGFNVFSICKVYLELSSLGCFLVRGCGGCGSNRDGGCGGCGDSCN